MVAHAAPDGYTLLTLPSAHAVTGAISKLVKYRTVEDFAWISTVSFYPFILCVRKDSPIANLADLIARARSKPQALSYGSSGPGTIQHMTAELVANATDVKFLHVLAIIAKVRPAQFREISGLDDASQQGLAIRAKLLRRCDRSGRAFCLSAVACCCTGAAIPQQPDSEKRQH